MQQAAPLRISGAACNGLLVWITHPGAGGSRRGWVNGFAAPVSVLPCRQVCAPGLRKCCFISSKQALLQKIILRLPVLQ
jgi:hypothetical protein